MANEPAEANEHVEACRAALPAVDIRIGLGTPPDDGVAPRVVLGTSRSSLGPVDRHPDGSPAEAFEVLTTEEMNALFESVNDAGLLDGLAPEGPPAEGAWIRVWAAGVAYRTPPLDRSALAPLAAVLPGSVADTFDLLLYQLETHPDADRALVEAVVLGDAERVEACLAGGADPNADSDEPSPLSHAVRADRVDLARPLLRRGAEPAGIELSQVRGTAMMALLWGRGARFVEDGEERRSTVYEMSTCVLLGEALRRGADPNVPTSNHETPLTFHADWGNLEAVQTLLKWGADPNYVDPESGISVLGFASASGNLEIVRELLGAGASVSHPSPHRSQCLARALMRGHVAVAEALHAAGARLPDAERDELLTKLRARLRALEAHV